MADPEFAEWLGDRGNRRQIPHRMEAVGYVAVLNDTTEDGRWKVGKKNVRIYASRQLSISDRLAAARKLAQASR